MIRWRTGPRRRGWHVPGRRGPRWGSWSSWNTSSGAVPVSSRPRLRGQGPCPEGGVPVELAFVGETELRPMHQVGPLGAGGRVLQAALRLADPEVLGQGIEHLILLHP